MKTVSISPRIQNYKPTGRVATHKITVYSQFFSSILWRFTRREIALSLFPFKLFAVYDVIITNTN